jgi:hypothetical protein
MKGSGTVFHPPLRRGGVSGASGAAQAVDADATLEHAGPGLLDREMEVIEKLP